MRILLAAAVAASALVAPAVASAGSFVSTGQIESVNYASNTLRIRGGDAYKLPSNVDVSQFQPGQRVSVEWSTQNPRHIELGNERYIRGVQANDIRALN